MSYLIVGFISMSFGAGLGMLLASLLFVAGHEDDCENCTRKKDR